VSPGASDRLTALALALRAARRDHRPADATLTDVVSADGLTGATAIAALQHRGAIGIAIEHRVRVATGIIASDIGDELVTFGPWFIHHRNDA
jgi:hypothetical protein